MFYSCHICLEATALVDNSFRENRMISIHLEHVLIPVEYLKIYI